MDSQLRKTQQCQKTVMVLHLLPGGSFVCSQWHNSATMGLQRFLAYCQTPVSCYSIGPAANPLRSAVISCHLIRCYYTSCLHIIWFHNNSHSCQEGWLWFRGTMSKPIVDDFSFQIFGIVCQAWLWIPSQTRLERLPPRLPVVDPPLLRLIN